jgi:hypothetical protein
VAIRSALLRQRVERCGVVGAQRLRRHDQVSAAGVEPTQRALAQPLGRASDDGEVHPRIGQDEKEPLLHRLVELGQVLRGARGVRARGQGEQAGEAEQRGEA